MKNLLLLLILISSQMFGQTSIFQTIPATGGANSAFRAPNGTSLHTSLRAHYIIPASELTALPSGIDITSVAFNLISGTDAMATGNLKFYMENTTATTNTKSTTWATAITGMDSVYDGSFTVPNTTGAAQAPITLSDTFNYTGGGIFIAYEYIGSSFGTVNAIYDCNNTLASGLRVIYNATTTPGAILSSTSSWRPILTVGYANPFTNDMIVDNLTLNLGHHNQINDTNQTVVGIVRNKSSGNLTSIPVTLTITGANPSVSTQTIASLSPGSSDTLTFSGLSAAMSGMQTVKLSVPSDQFTSNDSLQLVQSISCDTLSYTDNSAPYTAIGFNMGSGILAAKHTSSSSMNTTIKAIYANIDANTNITGNQLQAVLLDTGGNILDSSAIVTISSAQLGARVVFPLTGNNLILPANPDYFIGIRQYPDTSVGYFPLSSHSPSTSPGDRYYSFNMDGSSQSVAYTTLGNLGVGALLEVERLTLANSDANDSICPGERVTFTASGASYPSYNFKNGATSLQNTASTTYVTNPTSTTTISVEAMYNSCPVFSNISTINVVIVNATANKMNDTTAMAVATGASYQWIDCGTGLAVAGETSQTFITTATGNYKVAVTQNGCSDTSSCYNLIKSYAGIDEGKIESLEVFPSPATSVLTVKTDNIQISSVVIMEVSGKIISTTSPNNRTVKLDVANLPSGIYLLQVVTEKGTEVRRFIKQ